MNPENLEMLERAVEQMERLDDDVVFVGGATVDLWISDQAAPEFRLTEDIDVVVEIGTQNDYYQLEERLREIGFKNDTDSQVICRFRRSDPELVLDVLPTEASIIGFSNEWLKRAFPEAVEYDLPSGTPIKVIPPAYLLATKLEAFKTRGGDDFYGSRDFGDIAVLVDGREELIAELSAAEPELRNYVSRRLEELTRNERFDNGLEAALPLGPETSERVIQVTRPRIDLLMTSPHRRPEQDSNLRPTP